MLLDALYTEKQNSTNLANLSTLTAFTETNHCLCRYLESKASSRNSVSYLALEYAGKQEIKELKNFTQAKSLTIPTVADITDLPLKAIYVE
jgi:hypothetical protein